MKVVRDMASNPMEVVEEFKSEITRGKSNVSQIMQIRRIDYFYWKFRNARHWIFFIIVNTLLYICSDGGLW